VPSRLTA